MYQCPISFFTKNIIFNQDKSAWAVYKLSGFDYDFLDDDAKIKILHKTARFLSGILSEAQYCNKGALHGRRKETECDGVLLS